MSNTKQSAKVTIHAKVFRKGSKPKLIPEFIWNYLAKKRVPFTGRWEDLGEIDKQQLNARIIN